MRRLWVQATRMCHIQRENITWRPSLRQAIPNMKDWIKLFLSAGGAVFFNTWMENHLKRKKDGIDFERDLNSKHQQYSDCMNVLYRFRSKYGREEYAKVFGSPHGIPEDDFKAVNRCRCFCKDYWREFFLFYRHFGIADSVELEEYRKRHRRFTELVQPLDSEMEGYDEADKRVFVFKSKRYWW